MRILTILGTGHKGNTKAVVDLFLDEFKSETNEFDEVILPKDLPDNCIGCANCILKGEDKCPHYDLVHPIVEKMEKADLIVLATPVFAKSCSSGLKSLLDHICYMWFVHRPNEIMFDKVGLIITSAGGSGVKATVKLLKTNLFYLGIPKIHHYGITTMKMGGNYDQYKKKDKIKLQVHKKANAVKTSLSKRKVNLKSKLYFNIFRMTQKNGWNKTDSDYWREKGWINDK